MELKSIILYFLICTFNLSSLMGTGLVKNMDYKSIEKEVVKETTFKENGVKIQYNIKSSLDKEIERIKGIYIKENKIEETEDNSHFYIVGDKNIEVNLWCEDGIVFVEAISINNDKVIDTISLKNNLKKLQNKKTNSVKYFEYYKGRLNSINSLKEIKEEEGFTKVHNGYVGNYELKSGSKISYGIMEYDTGVYVIVGTPIIFTTY
ncbi:MAG: hypothetical protein KIB43_00360 [Clostridium baratii]|uniref:TATA-box binding n=1 Tax=Clostridium baratii str. Sullivan TaxID=1415775 RepID=A0A0A7FSN5_9CLOT|nr:hypothetical protein [Clostridium baratii]AIY82649.1 hypothetical protein U729_1631 [Clostridium baratii str. Sullivan]MBS6005394.1 hypothetical protein [Clostridium baratii]MDU1052459.1 hypothetical protein [Clostridium baratii]MDU4909949.1 hypothetical protein [Clostridium baratii]CUP37045.1 Uncharacterised protein [Clostridium baratii]